LRAVVQRVRHATVGVDGKTVGAIGPGLLVLLGCASDDGPDDITWLAAKSADLRIFDDEAGVMNRSVKDIGGAFTAGRSVPGRTA